MFEVNDKRSQILQAAIKLFAQKGFYHTTVEEVATEAGVGKGTVYGYFSSKQELLRQMFYLASKYYFDRFFEILEGNGGLKEKLKTIAREHFRFFSENKDLARVVLYEHRYITEDLEDWLVEKEKKRVDYLVDLLHTAAEQKEIRQVDSQVAARVITGSLWNVGLELALLSFHGTEEQLTDGIVDIFWSGLQNNSETGFMEAGINTD